MRQTKFFGILIYKRSSNLSQTTRSSDSKKKKQKNKRQKKKTKTKNKQNTTCQIVDFAVPADHRVKFKESEKTYKYPDLAR